MTVADAHGVDGEPVPGTGGSHWHPQVCAAVTETPIVDADDLVARSQSGALRFWFDAFQLRMWEPNAKGIARELVAVAELPHVLGHRDHALSSGDQKEYGENRVEDVGRG